MKTTPIPLRDTRLLAAAILSLSAGAIGETSPLVTDAFLRRIAAVESGCDDGAVNAAEGAYGRYQIRAAYLADANDYLGTTYTLSEMHDPAKAAAVVRGYLMRYGARRERATGRPVTEEELARIHNGGPDGASRDATLPYLRLFREAGGAKGGEGRADGHA